MENHGLFTIYRTCQDISVKYKKKNKQQSISGNAKVSFPGSLIRNVNFVMSSLSHSATYSIVHVEETVSFLI